MSHKGTGAGDTVWGKTYIEVDISQQHMWLIQNGAVTFETDVVTGAPHMSTPTGIFNVLEKRRDKTLRGKPLPNGKPSYLVPVKYWVRVTWSGIGFHDSSSRTAFGGEIYKSNGSHGCINMPPSKVPSFYSKVSVGTPILIHY